MENVFEYWQINRYESYVVTSNRDLAMEMLEAIGQCGTYELRGKIVLWQFLVPTTSVGFYRKKFNDALALKSKNVGLENQQLTGTQFVKSARIANVPNGPA